MKYLLKIAYVGTAYHGFQAQNNAPSIQRVLTDAATGLFAAPCEVTGCSRTDAGVHANEFCVTLKPSEPHSNIKTENIPRAMCSLLPNDIGVLSAEVVDDSFHPRYSAKGKEYQYLVYTKSARNPFYHERAWMHYLPVTQDMLDEIRAAASAMVGEHDFTSFMSAGSSITDAIREIYYFDVDFRDGILEFKVAANGFLYNMVRIMVGTLIYVGEGRISASDIGEIIRAKDRSRAGITAPPEGLYLNKVMY